MELLQYPIGKFDLSQEISESQVAGFISEIEKLPAELETVVKALSPEELETPYRPGGWKVKQVVHHLVDSHMNAYIRFNLALTEDAPIIRPYKENLWAGLTYKESQNIHDSLQLIGLIHRQLVLLMRSMKSSDFERTYVHPEYNRVYSLKQAAGTYAWHGKHHLAHITRLRDRNFDKAQ